jgi:hypothetical protein
VRHIGAMADVDARAFEDTRAFVTARPEPSD